MAIRRDLKFASLDEAVRDAEQLLARGYERAGNWDLARCCHHLAVLMGWPIDGFPPMSLPRRVAAWLLKHTFARRWLRKVLETGTWPAGTPTDERTFPPPGCTDAEAVAMLRQAVGRIMDHPGPFQESTLFEIMDRDTVVRMR